MDSGEKADVLRLMQTGTIELEGVLPWSSNYSFLVRVCSTEGEVAAVYKPRRGERPLWDFRQGTLCLRERAAFLVSDAIGWDLVPPTVLREGEHGIGSVQFFIEHDPEKHYFTFEGSALYRPQLQKLALLDVVINNADRKGGHVLLEESEVEEVRPRRLWGIDHGICFHTDYKLRTVIWEFAGEAIPASLREDLVRFAAQVDDDSSEVRRQLQELLNARELAALKQRLERVLQRGKFPNPGPGRHYPWPPV